MAGAADSESVSMLKGVFDVAALKDLFEPGDAYECLGVEGGGGLDGTTAVVGRSGEDSSLDPGGYLVLAALSGDHDR